MVFLKVSITIVMSITIAYFAAQRAFQVFKNKEILKFAFYFIIITSIEIFAQAFISKYSKQKTMESVAIPRCQYMPVILD